MKINAWNVGTGEREELEVPVIGYESNFGAPVLGLKMMTDERWMELCEVQRLNREAREAV